MLLGLIALLLGAAIGYLICRVQANATLVTIKEELVKTSTEKDAAAGQISLLNWQINNQIADTSKTQNLDAALTAVKTTVAALSNHALDADRRRAEAESVIKDQISTMSVSTLKFTQALSNSQSRGKYGETQLEMLLENAQLIEGVHFERQSSQIGVNANTLRPDIKILLPGGTVLYVDSKFPFDKFSQAYEAETIQDRADLMAEHVKDLLKHIDVLAKRRYHDDDASPDFVVLFAPFESILSEALESDPLILEKAFAKGVTIATPTTMLALLRTVGYVFGRNKMSQSATQIQELAGDFLRKVTLFHSKLTTLGDRIKSSERAYNDLVATAQTSILVPAKKMVALGVGSASIRQLAPIDEDVREIKTQESLDQLFDDPTLDLEQDLQAQNQDKQA